jgi:hypothetical protein
MHYPFSHCEEARRADEAIPNTVTEITYPNGHTSSGYALLAMTTNRSQAG